MPCCNKACSKACISTNDKTKDLKTKTSSWTLEASYNLTNAEEKKLGKTHTFSTDVNRLNFNVIEVITS